MKKWKQFTIILGLIISLAAIAAAIPTYTHTTQAASKKEKKKKAIKKYKKILQKNDDKLYFVVIDINNDGIPELLTYASGMGSYATLYYYYKGKIKESVVSYDFVYYKKGGIFQCYHRHQGYDSSVY